MSNYKKTKNFLFALPVLLAYFLIATAASAGETVQSLSTGASLYGVWGSSSDNIFAAGSNGLILRYDGKGWATMYSVTPRNLAGIRQGTGDALFAVGSEGLILNSGRTGEFWIGFFVAPGAKLSTQTSVSSEEDEGGFDVQLQLGVAF